MPTNYLPKEPIQPGYYVYEHWRLDAEVPFYVGAGHDGRAWAMWARRNVEHRHVIRELRDKGQEPVVLIVEQGLTKSTAHRHEHALIKEWRERGVVLVNCADLPDRNASRSAKLVGRVFSAESREKMRQAKLGTKQTPEHVANRFRWRQRA
jgi:hypothetical protein